MKQTALEQTERLERITRKWWFFLIIVLISFLSPYAQKPYDPRQISLVINTVLSQPLIYSLPALFPLFKIIPLALIVWVFVQPVKAQRWFSLYAALILFTTAFFQNAAITDQYGFAVITGNVILFCVLGVAWLAEALRPRSDFSARPLPRRAFILFPLMFIAFWMPIQPDTLRLSFDPLLLFTNEAGLAFCMMLPVFTGVLVIFYPQVNLVLLRLSGFIGLLIALFNLLTHFVIIPANFWIGVLHLPLLLISLIAFILSLKRTDQQPERNQAKH